MPPGARCPLGKRASSPAPAQLSSAHIAGNVSGVGRESRREFPDTPATGKAGDPKAVSGDLCTRTSPSMTHENPQSTHETPTASIPQREYLVVCIGPCTISRTPTISRTSTIYRTPTIYRTRRAVSSHATSPCLRVSASGVQDESKRIYVDPLSDTSDLSDTSGKWQVAPQNLLLPLYLVAGGKGNGLDKNMNTLVTFYRRKAEQNIHLLVVTPLPVYQEPEAMLAAWQQDRSRERSPVFVRQQRRPRCRLKKDQECARTRDRSKINKQPSATAVGGGAARGTE